MKKVAVIAVAVLSLALTWAPNASAAFLTGGFSIANTSVSGFEWLCGPDAAPVNCSVAIATLLDFQADVTIVDHKTPGDPGLFVVNSTSGSFGGINGLTGSIEDFDYVGAGGANFPAPPIASFQVVGVGPGTVTVDLTDILSVITICSTGCDIDNDGPLNFPEPGSNPNSTLSISGTALFHLAGFQDTLGFFSFSGGQGASNFSFAAQNSTAAPAVPEPTSLLLLGLGLTGLVVGRRLKK